MLASSNTSASTALSTCFRSSSASKRLLCSFQSSDSAFRACFLKVARPLANPTSEEAFASCTTLGRRPPSSGQGQRQAQRRQRAHSPGSAFCRAVAAGAMAEVPPAVIVGGGRVGLALWDMGTGKDAVVRRGESIPGDMGGPIIVCTRTDALDGIVKATPESRREDLVFIQNGMLEPFLAERGLSAATQVLVYFAVGKVGVPPIDGKTDLNPEGLTAACGKWAQAVAARLHAGGLSCKVLDPPAFRQSMFEKLIWICAFMLVGARHPPATVGDVESKCKDEVSRLIHELAAAASGAAGVSFAPGIEDRLCAYAQSVATFPTAVKEFEWRNGYFYSLTQAALKEGKPDPCPLHTDWLREVGAI